MKSQINYLAWWNWCHLRSEMIFIWRSVMSKEIHSVINFTRFIWLCDVKCLMLLIVSWNRVTCFSTDRWFNPTEFERKFSRNFEWMSNENLNWQLSKGNQILIKVLDLQTLIWNRTRRTNTQLPQHQVFFLWVTY
jgi:hypothetical protein